MTPYYFLPWWSSDYIWKEWNTSFDMDREKGWTKTYLWELIPNLIDGIVVSRMAISPRQIKLLRQKLRFTGVILGDSGAHSYRNYEHPPFSCEDVLEFYAQGDFTYGLTVDMVASPWVRPGGLSDDELQSRLALTINNAERCLELHERYSYPFTLLGVVQGWDVTSYRLCAKALLKLGFTYLAIAGQRKLSLIKDAIDAVSEEAHQLGKKINIHVLGTGNPKILEFYIQKGITSFDSSTWLRKAWLSEKHNYFLVNGKHYDAYRATRVGLGKFDVNKLKWDIEINCSCYFCRSLGQQILLFRGHERNTRRGFHNICQYVQLLKAHRKDALV